jgi:leucyl aminopeptidase
LDLIINIKYNLILLFIQSIEDIINIEMIKNKISSEVIISLLKKKDFLCQNSSFQIISFFINDDLFEVAIIGISKNASHEKIKNNFGKVLHHVQAKKITDIIIEISSSIFYYILPENFAKLLQITLLLKTYQFKDFITDSKKINFIDFNCFLLNNLSNNQINFELGIKNGNIIGDSINFSRYLSDLPAKDLYPESFINIVKNKI